MYYPPCFVLFIYLYFALFFCLLNKHYRILLFNMNLGPIQGWNMEPLKNLTCWEEQDKTYLRCFYNFCFMRLGRTRDCILFILVPMLFFFLNTIIFLVFFFIIDETIILENPMAIHIFLYIENFWVCYYIYLQFSCWVILTIM